VLDAVADAMRLTRDEREHLTNLVHPSRVGPGPAGSAVRTDLRCLIDGMGPTPAFVHGRHGDILARNDAAGRLLGDLDALPAGRRTWSHLVFLEGPFRSMVVGPGWELLARRHVAYLRLGLSRYPGDPGPAGVVESLHAASADFRRLWAEHEVADWADVTCRLRHPVAGDIEIAVDVMKAIGEPDQWLVSFTTQPGSPAQEALRRLAA
jgi:hypothetical protein